MSVSVSDLGILGVGVGHHEGYHSGVVPLPKQQSLRILADGFSHYYGNSWRIGALKAHDTVQDTGPPSGT